MWPRTRSAVRRGCSRTITCTLLLMTVHKTHQLSSLFIILLQYNCQLSTLHTSLVRRDTELCRAAAPVLGQFRSATDTRAVREECRRLSCLLSPPSTLATVTLNTHCSMEDADDSFYSIKDIKQINDEEFEAVFEFDNNEGEAIGLR